MSVRLHRRLNSTPLTGESPGLVYYTPKKEIQKHSRFNKFSKSSLCVSSTECFKRREKSKRCRFFQCSPRTPLYIRMKSIKKRLNFNDSLGSNEDQNTDSIKKQYQKGIFDHSKTNSIPQVIVSSISPQNKFISNECDNRISFVEIAFPNYIRTATPNTHKLFLCISPSQKSKLLGRGRFGRVIEKTYKDKKVAVKIINNHGNRYINSLHNEQNGISLKHPNVVNVIKVAWITTNTRISHSIILMNSYSNGCNLQVLLDNDDYDIDLCRIIRYSIHICRGLQYIHSHKILHLDIKPKNILAFPDDLCKICDFGTSIKFGEKLEENNILHQLQGTIRYCSPELLQGRSPTTASDVYSLSITFWQMEHRSLPYGFNIREESLIYQVVKNNLRPKITCRVFSYPYMLYNKIYERCWNKNPIKRLTLDVILCDISYIYRFFCEQIF